MTVPSKRTSRTPVAAPSAAMMVVDVVSVPQVVPGVDSRLLYSCSYVRHTTPRSMEWSHDPSVIRLQLKFPSFCTVQLLIGANPGPNLLTVVTSIDIVEIVISLEITQTSLSYFQLGIPVENRQLLLFCPDCCYRQSPIVHPYTPPLYLLRR